MKKTLVILLFVFLNVTLTYGQDANNPIDPNPTVGLWNRFYKDQQSRIQLLGNVTYGKWFLRFTTEYEINYNDPNYEWFEYDDQEQRESNHFNGANFLVARLFESSNGKHKFGVGAVASLIYKNRFAAGVNFVSVSKVGGWRFISLVTLQTGNQIFTAELQPGIYHDFNNGWYFRSHPRMLFNFKTGQHEIPLGAGIGKILSSKKPVINLFFEPQYDVQNNIPMLYTGIKTLF